MYTRPRNEVKFDIFQLVLFRSVEHNTQVHVHVHAYMTVVYKLMSSMVFDEAGVCGDEVAD